MALTEEDLYIEMGKAVLKNPKLEDAMKAENKGFRQKWFKAQLLLGNGPNSVQPALAKLEGLLSQTLIKRIAPMPWSASPTQTKAKQDAAAYWTGRNQGTAEKSAVYQHLLSEVLTTAEKDKDFTHETTGNWPFKARGVPYMASVVSEKVFDFQLQNSQQWKDVGVPAEHGEYTHRIQWYVISQSADIPQPAQLMKDLAKFGPSDESASASWDAVVDRLKATAGYGLFKAKDGSDFRSPENFNNYLTGGAPDNDYPLLTSFLKARRQKRETSFDLQNYVSKKLFNKTYAGLTPTEKDRVNTITDPKKEQGMIHRSEVTG